MATPSVALPAGPSPADRWRPFLTAGAVVAGAAYVRIADPTRNTLLWPCPLLELTGLWCPGCGLTRACYCLMQGQIGRALGFNLLAPILLALFLFGWLRWVQVSRGRHVRPLRFPRWSIAATVSLLVVFTVARNLPMAPFAALAP